MLALFEKWVLDARRAQGTHRTYQIPARLLREVIGERTALDSITKERIEELFVLLRRAPANATQRYPGKALAESIVAKLEAGQRKLNLRQFVIYVRALDGNPIRVMRHFLKALDESEGKKSGQSHSPQ